MCLTLFDFVPSSCDIVRHAICFELLETGPQVNI